MQYDAEQLMPIVAALSEKYTSKESSSVTYETARMLMEAVIYCTEQGAQGNGNTVMGSSLPDAAAVYEAGYDRVMQKVRDAREIYTGLAERFEDYGCRNYRDTVLKGMPEFFLRYDARFRPQEHLLTLDYPLLEGNPALSGVELILQYLQGIRIEKQFLECFDRQSVRELLRAVQPDYGELYFDNLCEPVLLNAVGCMIAKKPVPFLRLDMEDCRDLGLYFKDREKEETEILLRKMIRFLAEQAASAWTAGGGRDVQNDELLWEQAVSYFDGAAAGYAVRILNAARNNCIHQVFHVL